MTTPNGANPAKRKLEELLAPAKEKPKLTPEQEKAKRAATLAFNELSKAVVEVYWKPMKDAHKEKVHFVPASISTHADYLRQFYEDFARKEAIAKGTALEPLPPVFQLPPPAPMAPQPKVPRPVALEVTSYGYSTSDLSIQYQTCAEILLSEATVCFRRQMQQGETTPGVQYVSADDVEPALLRTFIASQTQCTLRFTAGGAVEVDPGVARNGNPIAFFMNDTPINSKTTLLENQEVEFRGHLQDRDPENPQNLRILRPNVPIMSFKVIYG